MSWPQGLLELLVVYRDSHQEEEEADVLRLGQSRHVANLLIPVADIVLVPLLSPHTKATNLRGS